MEHQTGKGTPVVHQNTLSSRTLLQPTRPQTFPESFYQCHLILPKVKAAPVVRDSAVGEGTVVVVVVVGIQAQIKNAPQRATLVGIVLHFRSLISAA